MALSSLGVLFLFRKFTVVIFNGGFDNFQRILTARNLINGGGFILKIFINLKEVAHLVKNMSWKLAYRFIGVIRGVIKGDRNDFFIGSAVIYHFNYTDRICSCEGQGL